MYRYNYLFECSHFKLQRQNKFVYFRVRPNVFNMENLEIVIERKLAISLLNFAAVFGWFADRCIYSFLLFDD